MAEAAHPMHPEVESELEYDGYSITQFIYDLLLFVDAIGFVVAWVFVGIYNEKIHSERDGIPQQSQQNPLAKAIESLLPWGLTRILVVLEIVQRSFQWYHGPRTFVKDEAWRKFKKTQKWNKWILIILRLGSLFCFLWGPLASTWFLKQNCPQS